MELKAGADAVKSIDRIVDNMEDILTLSDDSTAAKPYLFILRGRMPQSLKKTGEFTRPSAMRLRPLPPCGPALRRPSLPQARCFAAWKLSAASTSLLPGLPFAPAKWPFWPRSTSTTPAAKCRRQRFSF